MITDPIHPAADDAGADRRPILLVPYMWVGDFVRCHSVVRLLQARWPNRPVDVLTTPLTAPLLDYMPGVRKAVVSELPRRRLALAKQWSLAQALRREGYGTALIMPRTWKSVLAPFLAGIPERTGFVGEWRFVVLNDIRWGERRLPRMVDQCCMLALPEGAPQPPAWPAPQLRVPQVEIGSWRARRGLAEDGRPVIAVAPGSVAASRRWPVEHYADFVRQAADQGFSVWVLGGPNERELAHKITGGDGAHVHDLTGSDLRDAILALAAATAVVSNDSGLLHVAAAIGTPTIGIFGPTDPARWAPLNPLAAVVETRTDVACRPCHMPYCAVGHHRCLSDIPASHVLEAVRRALARADQAVAS